MAGRAPSGVSSPPGREEESTGSGDRNMIDGGPAARFTERLKELIESGYGLIDEEASEGRTPRRESNAVQAQAEGQTLVQEAPAAGKDLVAHR